MSKQEVWHADVNYFEAFRTFIGSADSGEIRESRGMLIMNCGLPIAAFNLAFVTRLLSDPVTAISQAHNYFRDRELPFLFRIRADLDPRSEEAALARGFEPVNPASAMVLHPVPNIPAPPTDLEIRKVREEEAFEDFRSTCAAGFGMPELPAVLSPRLMEHPSFRWFIGYVGRQPVTTALLFQTGSVAGVYCVATVGEFRRRGFGEAMTWAAVSAGVEAGCDIAILQPSGMGRSVYERMGFRSVAQYNTYRPPDT